MAGRYRLPQLSTFMSDEVDVLIRREYHIVVLGAGRSPYKRTAYRVRLIDRQAESVKAVLLVSSLRECFRWIWWR